MRNASHSESCHVRSVSDMYVKYFSESSTFHSTPEIYYHHMKIQDFFFLCGHYMDELTNLQVFGIWFQFL
jgi:hypothetical protein